MKAILIVILFIMGGCAMNKHTHEINHCGGIDIPICYVEVEGQRNLDEEIELLKPKMLRTMTLIIDQTLQTLLMGIK